MRPGQDMSVQTVRLLPWDIGCSINPEMAVTLRSAALNLPEWKESTDVLDDGAILSVFHDFEQLVIELHLYEDGIGLLEILENPSEYDSSLDFDPEVHAVRKRDAASQLLGKTHEVSSEIQRIIDALRLVVRSTAVRASGMNDWERGGFSYVFSFHLISLQSDASLSDVCDKAARLLHPVHSKNVADVRIRAALDLTEGLISKISEPNAVRMIEFGQGLVLKSTWATLCAIGRMTSVEKSRIRQLERIVQRHWFYCYVAEQNLKMLFIDLRRPASARVLAAMGETAADAQLVSIRLRDIRSSMATQAELDAYEELVRTSRLDQAVMRLDSLVAIFLNRLSGYVEQRRLASTRTIEVTIVVLAIVSATADFAAIFKEESTRSAQLAFVGIIVCLVFLALIMVRGVARRDHRKGGASIMDRNIRDIWRRMVARARR